MTDETKALMGLYDGMTACKKNRFGTPSHPVRYLVCCMHLLQHHEFEKLPVSL